MARWRLDTHSGDYWIARPGEPIDAEAPLTREAAAWMVDAWFPDAAGGGPRRWMLAEMCREAGHVGLDSTMCSLASMRALLADALRGGVLVAVKAKGPALSGGGAQKPPDPKDKPADKPKVDPVNPVIEPATLVVVVKKLAAPPGGGAKVPYTNPARKALTLKTDAAFDGKGTFTSSGGKVKFFSAASGGVEITFDGKDNVFPPNGAPPWAGAGTLSGGVTVYVEGVSPSGGLDDITVKLELSGGSKPVGPPDTSTITSVEVTLDICKSRTAAQASATPPGDPAPISPDDKINVGRYLHVQDGQFNHGRAMLIVQAIKPAAFQKELELRALDAKVSLYAADAPPPVAPGGAAPAAPAALGTQTIAPADLPKKFWAEGRGVSGALVDTGFQLGIKGIEADGDKVKCTVVQFTQIKATIKATPETPPHPTFAGPGAPADHSFTSASASEDFTANAPLVLMRNAQPDIKLELTVAAGPPAASLPIQWKPYRNPADAGAIGGPGAKPALGADPADAGNKLKAQLATNERGSFRLRPFIDCNGSGEFEDREPSIPMNLILVDATLVADRSIAQAGSLRDSINAGSFGYSTGRWPAAGTPPPLTAAQLAAACMAFDIDADVVGGGADGKLGLDQVFSGLCNNEWIEHNDAAYVDRTTTPKTIHALKSIYASNLASATGADASGSPVFLPGDPAAVILPMPVLDTGRNPPGLGGESAVMGRSFEHTLAAVQPAVGERWTIQCIDSPGNPFDRTHPANANAILFRVQMQMQFVGNFCFWTNVGKSRASSGGAAAPADRVYSVLRTQKWEVKGEWSIDYTTAPPTFTRVSYTATNSGATISPLGRAQDNAVEVRPPSTVSSSILGYDGTESARCSHAPGSAPAPAGSAIALAFVCAIAVLRRRRRRRNEPAR